MCFQNQTKHYVFGVSCKCVFVCFSLNSFFNLSNCFCVFLLKVILTPKKNKRKSFFVVFSFLYHLFLPCQHFLWFSLMFQRMERPIVVLALGIRLTAPSVYHLDHIYYRLIKTVCFHHFLHVKFVRCSIGRKKQIS